MRTHPVFLYNKLNELVESHSRSIIKEGTCAVVVLFVCMTLVFGIRIGSHFIYLYMRVCPNANSP